MSTGQAVSGTSQQYEAEKAVAVGQAEHSVEMIGARVQICCHNFCGGMVIEYLGAHVAMLWMVYFGNSPVFAFEFSVTSAKGQKT